MHCCEATSLCTFLQKPGQTYTACEVTNLCAFLRKPGQTQAAQPYPLSHPYRHVFPLCTLIHSPLIKSRWQPPAEVLGLGLIKQMNPAFLLLSHCALGGQVFLSDSLLNLLVCFHHFFGLPSPFSLCISQIHPVLMPSSLFVCFKGKHKINRAPQPTEPLASLPLSRFIGFPLWRSF